LQEKFFLRKKISGVLGPKQTEIDQPKGYLHCKKICRENLYRSTYSFRVVILQPLVERSVGEKEEKGEKKRKKRKGRKIWLLLQQKLCQAKKHMRPLSREKFFIFTCDRVNQKIYFYFILDPT
jgi:hypothetical protein